MFRFPWQPSRYVLQWEADGYAYKLMVEKIAKRDFYRLYLHTAPIRSMDDDTSVDRMLSGGGGESNRYSQAIPAPEPWLPNAEKIIDDLERLINGRGVKGLLEKYQFGRPL